MVEMFAILAVIVITVQIQTVSGIGNKTIKMKVQKGETVVLKCSNYEGVRTWLGPDVNNVGQGVQHYFSNNDKNPKLNLSGYLLQENEGNYDLIIVHFLAENTGCYICRVSGNGLFHETRYNVSLLDTSPTSTIMYDEGSENVLNTTIDWETKATQITEGDTNDNPCSCNLIQNYEYWKVSGGFVGGFLVCLILSNIFCYMKHKKASKDLLDVPLDVQYDEIGTINYNVVNIQTLRDDARDQMFAMHLSRTNTDTLSTKSPTLSYSSTNDSLSVKTVGSENTYQSINIDQSHTQEHRKCAENTIPSSSLYDIETRSTKSSFSRFSSTNDSLSGKTGGADNTYEPINIGHNLEFMRCTVSTSTLTSVYENTVVFPITSHNMKGDQGDTDPWLFIYNRIEN